MEPLKMFKSLKPHDLRKLLTIRRPLSAQAGCLLCMSGTHVRVINSPGTGQEIMLCKPCIAELNRRQVR